MNGAVFIYCRKTTLQIRMRNEAWEQQTPLQVTPDRGGELRAGPFKPYLGLNGVAGIPT